MKKVFSLILFSVFAVSLFAKPKTLEPVVFDRAESSYGKYTVRTEPSVEAVLILCNLAEIPAVYPNKYDKSEYVQAVESFFFKQKDHDAVKLVKNLVYKNGADIEDLIGISSLMNQDLTGWIQNPEPYNNYVTGVWKKGTPQKLLEAVNQFARDSKFDKFYLLHRPDYLKMHNGYLEVIKNHGGEFISRLYFNDEEKNILINSTYMTSSVIYPFGALKDNSPWDFMYADSPVYSKERYGAFVKYTSYAVLSQIIKETDPDLRNEIYELEKKLYEMKGKKAIPEIYMERSLAFQIAEMHRLYCIFQYGEDEEVEVLKDVVVKNYGAEILNTLMELYGGYFSKNPEERDYIRDLSSTEISQNIVLYKKQIEAYQK